MRFSLKIFTGNKFCLFNYATKTTGGFVDSDWFRTSITTPYEVIPYEDDLHYNFNDKELSSGTYLHQMKTEKSEEKKAHSFNAIIHY
jgi:hypothetical protein